MRNPRGTFVPSLSHLPGGGAPYVPSNFRLCAYLHTAAVLFAGALVLSLVATTEDPRGVLGTIGATGLLGVIIGHIYRVRSGEYERGRQVGYDQGYDEGLMNARPISDIEVARFARMNAADVARVVVQTKRDA